jgi:hypothetical protein
MGRLTHFSAVLNRGMPTSLKRLSDSARYAWSAGGQNQFRATTRFGVEARTRLENADVACAVGDVRDRTGLKVLGRPVCPLNLQPEFDHRSERSVGRQNSLDAEGIDRFNLCERNTDSNLHISSQPVG